MAGPLQRRRHQELAQLSRLATRPRSLGRPTRLASLDQRRHRKRSIPTANPIRAKMSEELDARPLWKDAKRNATLADVIQRGNVANTIAFQRIEPAPASRIRCLSGANARNTFLMRHVDQTAELCPPTSCGTLGRGRESDGEQDVYRPPHRMSINALAKSV